MSHRPNAKQPEQPEQPVSNANIDSTLTYDKKYAKAFSEVDTDHDGKISDAEVKALLDKEHLYVRLTRTLGITNVFTAILCACLVLGFVYSIKDTASSGGNLVGQTNGKALHTANKEESAPVTIDENALAGLRVIPVGSSAAAATRTEVGTIVKSQFLDHLNNAQSNTATGFAQYKLADGTTTMLVKYVAKKITKTNDGSDVSLEVEVDKKFLQFGVACQSSGTQCSIFAVTLEPTKKPTEGKGNLTEDKGAAADRSLKDQIDRSLRLRTAAASLSPETADRFARSLGGKGETPATPAYVPAYCAYVQDGYCDEPTYCAYGTDTEDCASPTAAPTTQSPTMSPTYPACGISLVTGDQLYWSVSANACLTPDDHAAEGEAFAERKKVLAADELKKFQASTAWMDQWGISKAPTSPPTKFPTVGPTFYDAPTPFPTAMPTMDSKNDCDDDEDCVHIGMRCGRVTTDKYFKSKIQPMNGNFIHAKAERTSCGVLFSCPKRGKCYDYCGAHNGKEWALLKTSSEKADPLITQATKFNNEKDMSFEDMALEELKRQDDAIRQDDASEKAGRCVGCGQSDNLNKMDFWATNQFLDFKYNCKSCGKVDTYKETAIATNNCGCRYSKQQYFKAASTSTQFDSNIKRFDCGLLFGWLESGNWH